MINNKNYWVLATLGGGNSIDYNGLYYLIRNNKDASKYSDLDEYTYDLKCFVEYGLIGVEDKKFYNSEYAFKKTKFFLTNKGSDALDYYKYCRYHNSNEYYKLKTSGPENISEIPQ